MKVVHNGSVSGVVKNPEGFLSTGRDEGTVRFLHRKQTPNMGCTLLKIKQNSSSIVLHKNRKLAVAIFYFYPYNYDCRKNSFLPVSSQKGGALEKIKGTVARDF